MPIIKDISKTVSIQGKDFVSLSTDILKKKGIFRFKAFGASMWPFIKQGDLLAVHPVEADTLNTGDIIFARMDESKIIVHRIIAIDAARQTVHMRGDSAASGGEIISYDQIYGIVTTIRRKNKIIRLGLGRRKLPTFIWHLIRPFRPVLLHAKLITKRTIGWFVVKLTSLATYRNVLNRILSKKIAYRRVINPQGKNLYPSWTPVRGQLQPPASPAISHFAWQAFYRSTPIGTATLIKFPDSTSMFPDWWIFAMNVRIPFRGAGIGRRLLQLAEDMARGKEGKLIYLIVDRDNIPARSLYRQLGFLPTSLPQLSGILKNEVKRGLPERIILKKTLPSSSS